VQIPDNKVEITGDALNIHLENVAVVDQFQFPGGTGNVPATISFDITYTKSGKPRKIRPKSDDPLSAFHWAGEMWDATNSGTFSVAYNDGSFSVQGSFSSSGMFGEMGNERNGVFLTEDDKAEKGSAQEAAKSADALLSPEPAILPAPLRARMRLIAK
jgi:hypothetical protein